MKNMLTAAVAAFVLVGFVVADDKKKDEPAKIDKAKLVGKWELTKSTDKEAPLGAIAVMEKDGKVTIIFDANGKEIKIPGKYEVKGDKLTITISPPGAAEESNTDTIKSLTDEKLVLVDKDGKESELTKKKK